MNRELMAGRRMRKTLSAKTFLQAVRREPGRPRACSVPSWWRLECINESVVEVPVLFREEKEEVMSSLVEVSCFVFRDRIQPRTVEQIADISEVVEELFFVGLSQDKVQRRVPEQNIEFPVDKFRSQTSEKCVDVVAAVCLERDAERSCEQGGFFEVSKIPSQDQMLHDVLVPQMIEQLMNVPKDCVSRQESSDGVPSGSLIFQLCRILFAPK